MPGMTPSVRIITDAQDRPAACEESGHPSTPAPEVTVARLLACSASVEAVSQPPE